MKFINFSVDQRLPQKLILKHLSYILFWIFGLAIFLFRLDTAFIFFASFELFQYRFYHSSDLFIRVISLDNKSTLVLYFSFFLLSLPIIILVYSQMDSFLWENLHFPLLYKFYFQDNSELQEKYYDSNCCDNFSASPFDGELSMAKRLFTIIFFILVFFIL